MHCAYGTLFEALWKCFGEMVIKHTDGLWQHVIDLTPEMPAIVEFARQYIDILDFYMHEYELRSADYSPNS